VGGTLRGLSTSGLPGLENVFANAILNEGYAQRDAIWTWLDGQPPSDFTRSLRGSLLNAIGWKEPEVALGFLEKLADQAENRELVQTGTQSLLNGGNQINRIEGLLEKASTKIRPHLLNAAFSLWASDYLGKDPKVWQARLNEVPEENRPQATAGLARSWAMVDPQAAQEWALKLPDGDVRDGAIGSMTSAWTQSDPREAATWVNTLPQGKTRDTAALALVGTMSNSEPETAWTWALSIETPGNRINALHDAYLGLHRKDPAIAREMLQSANLSEFEARAMEKAAAQAAQQPNRGAIYRPF
jgi:hypothetical protein